MLSKLPILRIIGTFFFIFILPCIASANLLVGDWGNKGGGINDIVMEFNGATGVFEGTFANGGGLDAPTDMAYGPDGNLYVASAGSNAILRYDGVTGTFISVASGGGIEFPFGITFGPDGNLYVSNPSGIFSDTVLSLRWYDWCVHRCICLRCCGSASSKFRTRWKFVCRE